MLFLAIWIAIIVFLSGLFVLIGINPPFYPNELLWWDRMKLFGISLFGAVVFSIVGILL